MRPDSETIEQIWIKFPFLCESDDFYEQFIKTVSVVEAPEKHAVISQGNECTNLNLILEGTVRVYKIGENGHEITLYRIGSGESCILTASSILSNSQSPALAITESKVKALVVPAETVRKWMNESTPWRNFVYELLSKRLADVIAVIEEVTFRRMDSRLAFWLLEQTWNENSIYTTHQHIAEEMGTAREVVSRILKDFESLGAIKLMRGEIEMIDQEILMNKFKPNQ